MHNLGEKKKKIKRAKAILETIKSLEKLTINHYNEVRYEKKVTSRIKATIFFITTFHNHTTTNKKKQQQPTKNYKIWPSLSFQLLST